MNKKTNRITLISLLAVILSVGANIAVADRTWSGDTGHHYGWNSDWSSESYTITGNETIAGGEAFLDIVGAGAQFTANATAKVFLNTQIITMTSKGGWGISMDISYSGESASNRDWAQCTVSEGQMGSTSWSECNASGN